MGDIEKKYREYFRLTNRIGRSQATAAPDRIRADREKLEALRYEIEGLIFDVDDPEIRNILRWRVLDGMTWDRIGRKKNQAKGWGHKKLTEYFQRMRKADA